MDHPVDDPRQRVATADAATTPPLRLHDPYAVLRQRNFFLYLAGGLFGALGGAMQALAVGWELYERTGSALALGWVGLVQAIPFMLLAVPAGQLADRLDRRRLMLAGMALSILCSVALAWVSWRRSAVGYMYVWLLVNAAARALATPASAALMPQLVSRALFSNAVTWNSTTWQIAAVAGPAAGGWLIGRAGAAAIVYVTVAALVLANWLCVAWIRSEQVSTPTEPASLRSLLAGFGFVWRSEAVLAAITLDLFAVLLGSATALLPVFAKDILQVGPAGLGWLRAAPALGALGMALVLAHRPAFRRPGVVLLGAVAGFGLAMAGFGLSRWFALSLGLLVAGGALDNISVVIRHSLVQLTTPDAMRGRVSAVNAIFISCSNELGDFRSGVVAALLGPVVSVVAGGLATLAVVGWVSHRWPEIRRLHPLGAEHTAQRWVEVCGNPAGQMPGGDR